MRNQSNKLKVEAPKQPIVGRSWAARGASATPRMVTFSNRKYEYVEIYNPKDHNIHCKLVLPFTAALTTLVMKSIIFRVGIYL